VAIIIGVVIGVVALAVGALLGYVAKFRVDKDQVESAEKDAAAILEEANAKEREIVLEAKEEAIRLRGQAETELKGRLGNVEKQEQRVASKEESLDRKLEAQERRTQEIEQRRDQINEQKEQLEELRQKQIKETERVAGLTAEEARELLLEELDSEIRDDAARRLRLIEAETKEKAEERAREILASSMQRLTSDVVSETTVSVVSIPSDEMKGRIIGREGRNIRAFEKSTGVDVIIDDTPGAVVLSGFNPVRREVARIALGKLIEDGRIHPGRIEEVVAKSQEEVEESMAQAAEEVLYELGIHNVHREIVKTLGRLKFRTSYGQNQLQHAKEVAQLAGNMAAEMGLDVQETKRAGVLHDVGKGLTHEHEGTHVELGYRLCKKHKETEIVLNAIRAHHDEEPHYFPETFLVTAGDAISGSRPGARREMFEGYVKRLEKLEELAMEHPGVERCFAIQAGREIRVMVEPDRVSDQEMAQISEVVARRIEVELQYPGQIKVVVIRETRAVDFAR